MDIWHELRIERTDDRRAIRRAYSVRLKDVHPEDDPAGFQRLRDAYERAIAQLDGPRRIEPMLGPEPPLEAPKPKPTKPKIPFRARVISHQRTNRKAVTPIIMTAGPNRKLPDRNPQPPKRRPKLERFRRDFLNNTWPEKRTRMVGLLLLPYDLDALNQENGRLSRRAQLHWREDFAELIEELKTEYSASLEELGIDDDTAEFWTAERDVTYSKDLWRGSAFISVAATVVVMLVLVGLRLADKMSIGPYPWWIETAWVFGVIATANRTWLSRRRHFWGLVCMTLSAQAVISEVVVVSFWLGAIALVAATSFPRASTYVVIGMAAQTYLVPFLWLGEALRWVLRVPPQSDPNDGLQAAFKPALAWLVTLSTFAGLVYDEPHAWTRVVFVTLWLICAEGLVAYRRSRVFVN